MANLKSKKRWILAAALLLLIGTLYGFFHPYLNFETLKATQNQLQNYYEQHQTLSLMLYFFIYVLIAASSIPGATVLTLGGGAIFGLVLGTVVISFASTIGATLAFLSSRYFLRDYVQSKFGDKLGVINQGVRKEGAFYLFALRLTPIFPFFIINLLMGLTPIKTFTFYWVSQIGMLAGTIVYVNAGTQLAQINSLSGILSLKMIFAFTILGLFPFLAKKLLGIIGKATGTR